MNSTNYSPYFSKTKNFFINCETSQPKSTAHAYAIVASFMMSVEMFIIKFISSKQNPFHLVLVRSIFALSANSYVIANCQIPIYKDIKGQYFWNLCFRGFLGFIVLCGMYLTFSFISLSEGMVLILLSPIWTLIFGKILMNENFEAKNIFLCILSIFGVYLILDSKVEASSGKNAIVGTCLALGTGILRALASLLVKSLTNKISIFTINQFHYLMSILFCSIMLMFLTNLNEMNMGEYINVAFAGFLGFSGQTIGVRAISLENPGIVGSLNYCSVIFSFFFDIIILGSDLYFMSIIGCVLISFSTVTILITKK